MESERENVGQVTQLEQQSIAALDEFEQKKEDEFVTLLVRLVMEITFNGYEKSDQVSPVQQGRTK